MKLLLMPLLLTGLSFANSVYGSPFETVESYGERLKKATPQSVLEFLKAGNKRFVLGKSIHGGFTKDVRLRRHNASLRQRPLATILSCIDSRTAPEIVFDATIGDLFTARVGGNVVNNDVIGSLEVAGSKVIIILGHKDCFGIKGACQDIQFGHFTELLAKIKPNIQRTNEKLDRDPILSQKVGKRDVSNPNYVAAIGHTNAVASKEQILFRSEYLRGQVEKGEIILIAALYDVITGEVEFDLH